MRDFIRDVARLLPQVFFGLVGTGLLLGAFALWLELATMSPSDPERYALDTTLFQTAPQFFSGWLIVLCALITLRWPIKRGEEKYGCSWGYEDDGSERVGMWHALLYWLPLLPDRSENYLWTFALLVAPLTFILRDQALNGMITAWGFTDARTHFWDAVSLIAAPLSATVITVRFLAGCRAFPVAVRALRQRLQQRCQPTLS